MKSRPNTDSVRRNPLPVIPAEPARLICPWHPSVLNSEGVPVGAQHRELQRRAALGLY